MALLKAGAILFLRSRRDQGARVRQEGAAAGKGLVVRWSLLQGAIFAVGVGTITGCAGGPAGGNSGGDGSSDTTVTFTFRGATPAAVASKTGSGSFTVAALSSGTLTLTIPSTTTTFAVAYVCPSIDVTVSGTKIGQSTSQFVFEASTADGTSFTQACPLASTSSSIQTGTLTGSIDASGISGASFLNVDAQGGGGFLTAYSATPVANISFPAPAGNDRVEVLAYHADFKGYVETFNLVGAKNLTSQPVPGALNGGNTVVLGAADQVVPQTITYSNVPAGYSTPTTLVTYSMTTNGGFVVADAATNQYPALPAAASQTGDSYSFLATARNNTQAVFAEAFADTGGPMTFTFPSPWTYAGPTAAALPTFDFAYSGFTGKTGVVQSASLGWSSGSLSQGLSAMSFTMFATANFQRGTTSMAFPSLSNLAGFLPPPASGTQVGWAAQIAQVSSGVSQPGASNSTVIGVQNAGSYTVP